MQTLPENPNVEDFVKFIVDQRLADVHTSLPAKVLRYDKALQQADVEVLIQRKYLDGSIVTLPIISNVPVWHPRAGAVILHMPVKVGHIVQLVFSERSLDRWLHQGGSVDPGDTRKHHLSDAVAYPGGYPFSDPASVTQDDAIEILVEGAEIRIDPSGKISFKGTEIDLGDHSLAEYAAVASKVLARLTTIESWISTHSTLYNAHVHVPPGGPIVVPDIPPVVPPGSIASDKVKVSY